MQTQMGCSATNRFLISICCCLIVACAADLQPEEIAGYALRLCGEPTLIQDNVTSVSSMINLIEYFENMPSDDGLANCRNKYLDRLDQLRTILTTNNEDGCSRKKISSIQENYVDYISSIKEDEESDALVVFFLHYAYKVSSVCKQKLLSVLKKRPLTFMTDDDQVAEHETLDNLDAFLHQFGSIFNLTTLKTGYSDFYVPWKLLDLGWDDAKPVKRNVFSDIQDDLSDLLNGFGNNNIGEVQSPRVSIKSPGANQFRSMQHACRVIYKPVYSKLVLPIIELARLGLYEDNEPLLKEIDVNKNLKRLFGLAQFCETILPIEAFQDESTKKVGKVVAVSGDTAAELRNTQSEALDNDEFAEPEHDIVRDPVDLSLAELDELDPLADNKSSMRLIETIVSNCKKQDKVIGNMMSSIATKTELDTKPRLLISFTDKGLSGNKSTVEIEIEAARAVNLVRKKRGFLEESFGTRATALAIFLYYIVSVIRLIVDSFEKAFLAKEVKKGQFRVALWVDDNPEAGESD